MARTYLSSIEAFDEPIDLHAEAGAFYVHAAEQLRQKGRPIIDHMRRWDARRAAEYERVLDSFIARLALQADHHKGSAEYLQGLRTLYDRAETGLTVALPPPPHGPRAE